ncbi:uncharacterized protein LOC144135130 [Amblyomma americanum]
MAAFKKTADPTASSCFFTRRLISRFYLVVQSERITIIKASEGHGPPERNLHEMSGTKIDEDNLSRGDERGASASCRQDTRSPTDPTPVPSPQPSQQHTPEPHCSPQRVPRLAFLGSDGETMGPIRCCTRCCMNRIVWIPLLMPGTARTLLFSRVCWRPYGR